jgi:hypothetical protein
MVLAAIDPAVRNIFRLLGAELKGDTELMSPSFRR